MGKCEFIFWTVCTFNFCLFFNFSSLIIIIRKKLCFFSCVSLCSFYYYFFGKTVCCWRFFLGVFLNIVLQIELISLDWIINTWMNTLCDWEFEYRVKSDLIVSVKLLSFFDWLFSLWEDCFCINANNVRYRNVRR